MAIGLALQDYGSLPVVDTAGRYLGKARDQKPKTQNQNNQTFNGTPTTTLPAIEAFNTLLSTLASGGTPDQKLLTEARGEEVSRVRKQQEGYTKDAAMSDAQALITKTLTDALRAAEPRITSYAEGAGASKSSMAALLQQEAATKGAVEGAALGAQLSTAYGQVFNQLEGILADLTKQDPNSPTAMLLQAIVGSRGLIEPAKPVVLSASSGSSRQESSGNAPNQGLSTDAGRSTQSLSLPSLGYGYYNTPAYQPQTQGAGIIQINPGEESISDSLIGSYDFTEAEY